MDAVVIEPDRKERRGGYRANAGKPKGAVFTKETQERFRALIKTREIVQMLNAGALGEIEVTPARATMALGLLRKVLPDVAIVEMTGNIEHNHVVRLPVQPADLATWRSDYVAQAQPAITSAVEHDIVQPTHDIPKT